MSPTSSGRWVLIKVIKVLTLREPVTISNSTWETPAWKTNRAANFMMTADFKAHPWVFEDVGLHLEDSAELLFQAIGFYDKAIAAGGDKVADVRKQRDSIAAVARAIRGKSLHFLETLTAQDARLVGYDPKQSAIVLKRLDSLLEKDVENQGHESVVAQKLADFRKDPNAWLDANLNPVAYESKCTVDWNKVRPLCPLTCLSNTIRNEVTNFWSEELCLK